MSQKGPAKHQRGEKQKQYRKINALRGVHISGGNYLVIWLSRPRNWKTESRANSTLLFEAALAEALRIKRVPFYSLTSGGWDKIERGTAPAGMQLCGSALK